MSVIYDSQLLTGSRVYDSALYTGGGGGTAPTISTTSLPGGTIGSAYSQTLAATGDTPITWTVTVGALPAGLSLNSGTGAITGTPTTAGTSSFTVTAANGVSPDDTQALSIEVVAVAPNITTTSLPGGTIGTAYSQTLAATGTTPITWSVASGALPAGLSLNTGTGAITGTPTTAGTASFTIGATNGTSPDDTQALSIVVVAVAPTITTTTLTGGTVGTSYSRTLVATGTATITWSVTAGALPAGLSLSSGGVITGTPTTAEVASFTVTATNGTSPDDTQALSITIVEAATGIAIADRPAHVFIGINRIDEATLTGGSWPTLTLANILDRRLSRVARSADALETSTIIDIELTTSRALRAVALINHNLSADANWRVTIGTSSGAADIYDTGWQGAWAMTFDSEMIEWESDGWWGGIADDEYIRHPWIVCAPMIAYYSGQFVRIEISDTTNADGYVQIGRVFVGGGFVPRYNAQVNIAEGWNDGTTITTGPSGVEFIDEQRRSRFARFLLPRLELEDFKRVFELQRRLGIGSEVLFLPNTYSLQDAQRRGFLGRLRELNALESITTDSRSVSFHIGETL